MFLESIQIGPLQLLHIARRLQLEQNAELEEPFDPTCTKTDPVFRAFLIVVQASESTRISDSEFATFGIANGSEESVKYLMASKRAISVERL